MTMITQQVGNISNKVEICMFLKNGVETLELKIIIIEINNSLDGHNKIFKWWKK